MTADDDSFDGHVDREISACLNLDQPKSFFLFAGAGSGKTRSLVESLRRFRDTNGRHLRLQRKRVAVITYTNAACDEIKQRLDYDSLVDVSTIHSFVWSLIKPFHQDIKEWLQADLQRSIAELEEQQRKGRGGKAATDRAYKIESKQRRLAALNSIKQFTYSPTGVNRGRDALHHAEVIKIAATFLTTRPLMQSILVNQYPVLLVDESQDTNKQLMDALLAVQGMHRQRFALGLFGDTMQRIYSDGKVGLGEDLASDWATPTKQMNHRCPKRVVRLINKIRSIVDDKVQRPRIDKEEGLVRLFILPGDIVDKPTAERRIMARMSKLSADPLWNEQAGVKTLMLEHHMAATRMGFMEIFGPLYEADDGALQTSLLEGTLAGLRFFYETVLPLRMAALVNDEFAVAAMVRKYSPLLSRSRLRASGGADQSSHVIAAQDAVADLMRLWSAEQDPSLSLVLRSIAKSGLFEIPESLRPIALRSEAEQTVARNDTSLSRSGDAEDRDLVLEAWDKALAAPFSQIEPYAAYVSGRAPFGTHQGIKGLEFPRVLVVMDDGASRGFLFSYEKLFGAKAKSKTDLEHEQRGEDSSLARTRRLLYVTCSRAEKSLALVAYSSDREMVRTHVLREGWFENDEIETSV